MNSDQVDPHTVSPARRWNYWLGGKDHFQVDRDSGDLVAKIYPGIWTVAREGRAFHKRAVRHLAADGGIRQFLDIGTGLPAPDNTHEVAQAVAPDAKVVYVDNDPMVLTHARALMIGGVTTYVDADLRRPETILEAAELRATIDLSRPVGILLINVLHFIAGDEQARAVVRRLLDAVVPGSYLVATNATTDFVPAETAAGYASSRDGGEADVWPRDRATFTCFFDGLRLLEPGVVAASEWRPDRVDRPAPAEVSTYAAVGRK
ncbi:SAM-dependent methyltransferase [Actinoplanes oblitus]|uniref:SAM-dependent methyltransferase n=1 Tax=Actinoplanes oblitus TaxID=3040509 RepID=A0ABY8WQC8_9ACTN|nr:SAM-dependent methyltransferase [Actinoplanes oblitus]WIM98773.1 SAM-dependent methyltransferase [Actinoplanes oblitus]